MFHKVTRGREEWSSITVACARLLAATPQSCDVERIISKYNLLKDDLRNNLAGSTIRDYLYVQFNLPILSEFDVRPAVFLWLKECDRRPRETPPGKSAEYFKGVFKDAHEKSLLKKK